MIPPPPTNKPVALYDTECFPNYWLLKFRPRGGEAISFSLRAGESFDGPAIDRIVHLFELFTVVSFNGIYYDVPMIAAALMGYSCEQLKWLNDQIIVEERKPWELNISDWKPADHIDIIEVCPGAGSQKQYAGRIHCKTMRDLPYEPNDYLTPEQIVEVDAYCGNDLDVLNDLFEALTPQIELRVALTERYGIDLRSKSDAQLAEQILKRRCEQALGYRIYKSEVNWNMKFLYNPPEFLSFLTPVLQQAFEHVKSSIFFLGSTGSVSMPPQLDGLAVTIGSSTYRMGIGGLHSSEKQVVYKSDETHVLLSPDVASYYPNLIINSGEYPAALGPVFTPVYSGLKDERIADKKLEKTLAKGTPEWKKANAGNEGGKIGVNGGFGKTGNVYSILFAPKMLIQTTMTGQLALLMLIEWLELYGIPVVSANTDGLIINCPRTHRSTAEYLIKEWERRTGLEMETSEFSALYARDVNSYISVKSDGSVKRKGAYAEGGLVEKKNPDVEICSDAAAEFLSKGTDPILTIIGCRDIRKFVTVRKVSGGAVKMWGHGTDKDLKVKEIEPLLVAKGWTKSGRKWSKGELLTDARTAYGMGFDPQRPEYMGKVVRWYYSPEAPGPILYKSNGNTVSLSYGAKPCMTLPDEFPDDIDYAWYLRTTNEMLKELGVAI